VPRILRFQDLRGYSKELVVISGRLNERMRIGYDKTKLPLLEFDHPLAKLIMRESLEIDHAGQTGL
jgi:hypothetical protein